MKTHNLYDGEIILPIFESEKEVRDYFSKYTLCFDFRGDGQLFFKTLIPDMETGSIIFYLLSFFDKGFDFFNYETIDGSLSSLKVISVVAEIESGKENYKCY